jgi:hypothetical protein
LPRQFYSPNRTRCLMQEQCRMRKSQEKTLDKV